MDKRFLLKANPTRGALFGSIAVVVTSVATLVKALPAESWVFVGVLVVATVASVGQEFFRHQEVTEEVKRERLGALRLPPTPVKSADPFALGVTNSSIANRYRSGSDRPPYVRRDIDDDLDRLLRECGFVVVIGPSKAGKSRSAFEALARMYPERVLIAPEVPTSEGNGIMEALAPLMAEADELIMWLDDLQEFLKSRSLTVKDVNALRASFPQVIIVGTMRDGELAALQSTETSAEEIQRILAHCQLLPLHSLLSARELEDAASRYPDENFSDGLGVHFVAGQRLVQRFEAAREANPLAYAITAAAIDRSRAGIIFPATLEELLPLAAAYFHEVRPRSPVPVDEASEAVQWATRPLLQDIGLLLKTEESPTRFEPFEYITAYRSGEVENGVGLEPVPDSTWELLLKQHDGWDLTHIGYAACSQKRFEIGKRAFEELAEDSDPHLAAHGASDLGDVYWDLGDYPNAGHWYQLAAESGFDCVAGDASYGVALVLREEGEESEHWYRKALQHPDCKA